MRRRAASSKRRSGNARSPGINPVHLHYVFIGAATHLFVMAAEVRRITGEDPMRKGMIEAHADAVVSLLLGAPKAYARHRKAG
jgi:hypothetical protein